MAAVASCVLIENVLEEMILGVRPFEGVDDVVITSSRGKDMWTVELGWVGD